MTPEWMPVLLLSDEVEVTLKRHSVVLVPRGGESKDRQWKELEAINVWPLSCRCWEFHLPNGGLGFVSVSGAAEWWD